MHASYFDFCALHLASSFHLMSTSSFIVTTTMDNMAIGRPRRRDNRNSGSNKASSEFFTFFAHSSTLTSLSTALLDILTESQYPILRQVLPHLNQYDLSSLRASCKTLRGNLPATSSLLNGKCEYSQILSHLPPCNSSTKPLHPCEGVKYSDASGHEISTPCYQSKYPFWVCGDCVHKGVKDSSAKLEIYRYWEYQPRGRGGCTLKRFGRWIPICSGCFISMKEDRRETGRSVTENASTPQRQILSCKCFTAFEKRLKRGWHCPKCAFRMFNADAAKKFEDPIEKNRSMVWQKNPKSAVACGKCEELEKVRKWQRFGYYMCAGCEDLISGTY